MKNLKNINTDPVSKHKSKRLFTYNPDDIKKEICKDWLSQDPLNKSKAYCKWCDQSLTPNIYYYKRHFQS